MPEIEFQVDAKALEIVRNTELTANWQEVEEQLTSMIAPYRSMVVSVDGISSAKADRAKIRKVSTTIDDYRKTVKNVYSAPLKAFEERCKRLTAICAEGSDNLDKQIKGFEERQKAEKIAGLRSFFEQNAEPVKSYLSFEQTFNKRWENTTFSIEDAQEEIMKAIQNCVSGLEAIRGLNSPFEAELLSNYSSTHDIAGCMRKHSELMEIKRREEERRKAEEEARKRAEIEAEARRKALEEAEAKRRSEQEAEIQKFVQNAPKPEEVNLPTQKYTTEPEEPKETVMSVSFKVEATRKQLFALKEACDRIGIKIMRV